MTGFQIITICLGFLSLCGGIITTYTKNMIEIAKIQVQIKNLENENLQQEKSFCKLEARNTIEHDRLNEKLDLLIKYQK